MSSELWTKTGTKLKYPYSQMPPRPHKPWVIILSHHSGCYGQVCSSPSHISTLPQPQFRLTAVQRFQWTLLSQNPGPLLPSVEGWAVVLLERGWKKKRNRLYMWSSHLALCQNHWEPQESLMRVECMTAFVIPGLLGQLKSKTAVDFIDCSTNHVSKHSCNPFQNMPGLTHSCLVLVNAGAIVNVPDQNFSNFIGMWFA